MNDELTLPAENIWGHRKKLDYIVSGIQAQQCKSKKNIKVLDFGCGNGSAVTQYISKVKNVTVLGVDLHADSLNYARKNFSRENCSFSEEIHGGEFFDLIVYADVLEHLYDPLEILTEHNKILNNNGCLIIAIPNGFGPFEIESFVDQKLGVTKAINYILNKTRFIRKRGGVDRIVNHVIDQAPYNHESGHVQFYTYKKICSLLNNAGFEVIEFKNGVFLGANITHLLLGKFSKIMNFNGLIADIMPKKFVSTWYLTAKKINK